MEGILSNRRFAREEKLYYKICSSLGVITVFVFVYWVWNTNFSKDRNEPLEVCRSTECHEEAKNILSNLNTSVDPCQDFYQFSCGGWIANHSLPPDMASLGILEDLDRKVQGQVKHLFLQKGGDDHLYSLQFMRKFNDSCIDDGAREKRGIETLREVLESLGGWPLAGERSSFNAKTYDWKSALIKVNAKMFSGIIISLDVDQDLKDAQFYKLSLDQPYFGLGRNDLISNQAESVKSRKAYYEFISSAAHLFGAKGDVGREVKQMIEFEIKLAQISASPEDRRKSENMYTRLTLSELQAQVKEVDWFNFIKSVYKAMGSEKEPKEEDEIVIYDSPYIRKVSLLLKTMDVSVLANYIGWRVIYNLGYITSQTYRDIDFKFDHSVTGIEAPGEMWKHCLRQTQDYLHDLIGRKYIDAHFIESDRVEAEKIIVHVVKAFDNLLRSKDWMDNETKAKAVNKLQAMDHNVGYPLWLKNDTQLESSYNFSKSIDPTDVFEALQYLRSFNIKKRFNKMYTKINPARDWPVGASVVNAFYNPMRNAIIFPAAFLNHPYFSPNRPGSLNYGAIGSVVGHELTHGFDDIGAQFDEKGNLMNWWSNETKQHFEERSKCFINQYSSVLEKRVNLPLNGRNTVGENIADNGGLREAFDAYHLHYNDNNPDQALPGLEEYTQNQLFFISYAHNWCSIIREEKLRTDIAEDSHSPDIYRINIPVSNFYAFAEAFGCKPGTPMNVNKGKQCILW